MKADDSWVDQDACRKQEETDYGSIEKGIEAIQKTQGEYWKCF